MNELSADYIKAKELDRRIKTSAQLAQQSLYDMCMGFKEMRDGKLYKQLGYSNFEDYCEKETGFSRMNAYKYISIAEKLPRDFVNSSLQIGVTKLALLTRISDNERTEVTEKTDLENTSVHELEEKIRQLKDEKDQAVRKAECELKIKEEKASVLSRKLDDMNKNYDRLSDQRDKAELKIRELEAEIKELESRPIDVAVKDNSAEEVRLREALAENEKTLSALKAELKNTKAEYEKKLAEKSPPVPDVTGDESKVKFKILLSAAYDSLMRAAEFAKNSGKSEFKNKLRQLAAAVNKTLEG